MLRFDYLKQRDNVKVTVVSEQENSHSLAGRLILKSDEWEQIWRALLNADAPDPWDRKERFFKFEDKGDNSK